MASINVLKTQGRQYLFYARLLRRGHAAECLRVHRLFQRPIILGGSARSGTTLLLSLLSAHSKIFAIPFDSQLLCPGAYRPVPLKDSEAPVTFTPETLRPLQIENVLHYLAHQNIPAAKKYWCEKTPMNIWYFDAILEFFGKRVKLVQIIRDGRDVTLSEHPFKPGQPWVSTARWLADTQQGLKYLDHPQVHTLKYEDLVKRTEPVLRKLMDFLGESFEPAQLHPETYASFKEHIQIKSGIQAVHVHSVGKWRLPENRDATDSFMKNKAAAELLRKLDYPLD